MVPAVDELPELGSGGMVPAVDELPELGSGGMAEVEVASDDGKGGKVPAVDELPEAGSGGKAGIVEEELAEGVVPAGAAACELSMGGKGGRSCDQAAPNDMSMKDKTAMSWVIPLSS